MKFYFGCENRPRNGYTNIDTHEAGMSYPPEVIDSHFGEGCLDNFELAEEIIADNVLSRFTVSDAPDVIKYWLSRLSEDGCLIITTVDFVNLQTLYADRRISHNQLNTEIFGNVFNNNTRNKSIWDVESLKSVIELVGAKITSLRLEGVLVIVEIKKQ
ncbi:MAG: hypothetical protein WC967_12180 [Balneolaceae bacterium]